MSWFRKYRVVPVLMSAIFAMLLVEVVRWFMSLPSPTTPQAGFAGIMVSAAAAWFKFYVESGNKDG